MREHTTDAQQKGGSTTCKGALRADRGALRANRGARRASGEARRAKENTTCRTSVEGAGSQPNRLVCNTTTTIQHTQQSTTQHNTTRDKLAAWPSHRAPWLWLLLLLPAHNTTTQHKTTQHNTTSKRERLAAWFLLLLPVRLGGAELGLQVSFTLCPIG